MIKKWISPNEKSHGDIFIYRPWFISLLVLVIMFTLLQGKEETKKMKETNITLNTLTAEEERVILHKGTERPFSGKYTNHREHGYYTCKRCNTALYRSTDKFDTGCGWPSFDDEISGAVKREGDKDGIRTEIMCNHCGGHLGHVFLGEGLTGKDTRHCVNSISLEFVPIEKTRRALFASGCFWGTEYHMQKAVGVLSTTVGYTGGNKEKPTYREVCSGTTGHAEAVEVIYNPALTNYEELAKLFFETHDPTQVNGQGPDIGLQYRSEIFYLDNEQKEIALALIEELKGKGYKVATGVTAAGKFWPAEAYHQDYYLEKKGTPYCHIYKKRF